MAAQAVNHGLQFSPLQGGARSHRRQLLQQVLLAAPT